MLGDLNFSRPIKKVYLNSPNGYSRKTIYAQTVYDNGDIKLSHILLTYSYVRNSMLE